MQPDAGPFPVGECPCTGWVPDRTGIFKFRSNQRTVGSIGVAVSPDNISGCDEQKLGIGMIWQFKKKNEC